MRQRYKKPQIEVILPFQELMAVLVTESKSEEGPDGKDHSGKGDPDLNAKQWKFSVWDDEEESSDVWN